jgi:multiple sugar transport system permease protein/raffinose/stachyose/melibiose transport system permease protein
MPITPKAYPALVRKSRPRSLSGQEGLAFILPTLVLFCLFVLYPIFYIFRASTMEWTGITPGTFVGLRNYVKLFTDDWIFQTTLRNSFYWTFLTIFPQMFLGFALAMILNSRVFGRTVYRAIFYMPAIISPIVLGIVWQRIYNPFGGFLSDVARLTGLTFLRQAYLADPNIAIFSCILVNVWEWTGFSMLLYLAGLQGLSQEVLDAAAVDGANLWQRIRYVIWPMLRHVHLTLILLGVIGTLQTFALIFMLTKGGPNHASEMMPTYIFLQAFQLQSMGYASAISVILLLLALGLSVFQVRVLGARFFLSD